MPSTTQAPTTMRAAQAAETRRRLIEAATDIFAENSYDTVAVADIAKAAGVAHGLLFHYFGSKRGLYLEAMREAARQLDEAFIIDPDLSPARQLRQALAGHLRYLASHRGLALRLILGGRGADAEAWEVFESARGRSLLAGAAVLGLDTTSRALQIMGRASVGAIDEAAVQWLQNEQPFDIDEMVEAMVELIASGLRAAQRLEPALGVEQAIRALRAPRTSRTQPTADAPRRSPTIRNKPAKAASGGRKTIPSDAATKRGTRSTVERKGARNTKTTKSIKAKPRSGA